MSLYYESEVDGESLKGLRNSPRHGDGALGSTTSFGGTEWT